ncbi:hypothetical protein [Pseudemcibacter aquimaris]|uniref:hypothetical protein n=1 Tax=Pseudemcibacter aquimaris TaxID=2857064 RepID=UPI002011FD85|nr:hypothetical protein [Pseudemcibacter aquimaris]MCC3859772.1 hypothetical protein [Pseudemcibacter aquimaris]WDU60166.1 hypothetical protein KW060_07835 [Pseudemcibacter aquimaris]
MAKIELRNLGKLDKRSRDDFKDFSHDGTNGFYRDEIRAGRLSIYAVIIDSLRVGSVALRHEEQPHGGEMVIVAGGGVRRNGMRLVPTILGFLEQQAVRLGEKSIRFHTVRMPLVQVAISRGYFEIDDGDPDEVTMRKVLA